MSAIAAVSAIATTRYKRFMGIDENTKRLKKLPWVESARKLVNGYKIVTKDGALKTTLTHKVKMTSMGRVCGSKLPEELLIALPSYTIYLRNGNSAYCPSEPLWFKLTRPPVKKVLGNILMIPPSYSPHSPLTPYKACLGGATREEYRQETDWVERANIAAVFLQTAIPDNSLKEARRTMWAQDIGILPPELIEKSTV